MNVTTLNMATLDGDIIIKRGEGGGSTPPSGGESGIECFYYDQKSTSLGDRDTWKYYSLLVKVKIDNMVAIVPTLATIDNIPEDAVEAVCIANPMVYDPTLGDMMPFVEIIEGFDRYPFITKEQFYSLD